MNHVEEIWEKMKELAEGLRKNGFMVEASFIDEEGETKIFFNMYKRKPFKVDYVG